MPRHRNRLPQLGDRLFLTDGGLETDLVFHGGFTLPCFAAFVLLADESGRSALRRYFERYLAIARDTGAGFVLESPTWRANTDWGAKVGYAPAAVDAANRDAIALMCELRAAHEGAVAPIVISGCVGPRGDGYDPGTVMSPAAAEAYHARQIGVFAATEADMVTAITMTNANEAIGIARAARAAGIPSAISFTLETDGRLPTGQSLGEAVAEVDAATGAAPAYYMINCAHPTHFAGAFRDGGGWLQRVRGLRANASKRSHAELDAAPDLDEGDPLELAGEKAALRRRFGHITVLGGCCGTDHRHVRSIAEACLAA